MFIDTHAHLDFKDFNQDRDIVIQRAFENNVSKIINIGCNIETSKASIDLANQYENIFASIGIHPSDIKNVQKEVDEIESLIKTSKKIVAIGEIGLDYFWMECPKEQQVESLKLQLRLVKKYDFPVIIHCRNSKDNQMNAYEDCFEILLKEGIIKSVFHCFSGTLDFAKKVWDRGFFTSFTGIVTYPNAKNIQEVVKEVPEDKYMIETDCPFLAPQKFRGQRNEPSYVIEVANKIAEIKKLSLKDVEDILTKNVEVFFKI